MRQPNHFLPDIYPSDDTAKQISELYSHGIPLNRVAEIINIPADKLSSWIDRAMRGDNRLSNLRSAVLSAIKTNEVQLLDYMRALASPETVYKTISTTTHADGSQSQTVTETTSKPDYRAISYLLRLQSAAYRDADAHNSSVNVNINNGVQTVVEIPSNGRAPANPHLSSDT